MAIRLRRFLLGTLILLVGVPILAVTGILAYTSHLDRTNGHLVSSGVERRYLLFVPPTYDPSRATPLVISLHGAGAWPAQQMDMTHWNELAAEQGFIVVYPAARGRIWQVQHPGADPSGDVRFISDLIDRLERDYHIDTQRIYANGFSLGGAMTFLLSCRLANRLAAVGTVSAAQTLPWSSCGRRQTMPFIGFHGMADLVPYAGGRSPDPFNPVIFPPVLQWTADWAQRNLCSSTPHDSIVAPDVTLRLYSHCAHDAAVALYSIRDGGHAWPGGKPLPRWLFGRTTQSIDATRIMWAFFLAHPQRPPGIVPETSPRQHLPN